MNQLDPIPSQIAEHCNQPDPAARTMEDLDVFDLIDIAKKLLELLIGDDKAVLLWASIEEVRTITAKSIDDALCRDTQYCKELHRLAIEGDTNDAQQYAIDRIDFVGKHLIYDALQDYQEMPRGYDLEDYL